MRRVVRFLFLTPFLLLIGFAAGGGPVAAGGGCHGGTGASATEASSSVVKIDGCTFAPTLTRVPVGTEVTFINTSPGPHDVTGRQGEWGSATLESGASYKHRFDLTGVYAYSCSLHPGMAGIVVAGGPAVALSSDVQPVSSVTEPADSGALQPLPLVAASGVGLIAGMLVMAAVRRRTAAES